MAGVVADLSGGRLAEPSVVRGGNVVSPEMLDEAAEAVLSGVDEELRRVALNVWLQDTDSDVARLLRSGLTARAQEINRFYKVNRQPVRVQPVFTSSEVKTLNTLFPEYDLKFTGEVVHDHGLAAVVRMLGTRKCVANLPPSFRYADFGGSVLMHVRSGDAMCCTVATEVDAKDAQRMSMTRLALQRIATDKGASVVSRDMAQSVLARGGRYHVGCKLQDFEENTPAGIMVHVYDVPISEIAPMMERCGMYVLEGTMHFSRQFYEQEEGFLPTIGAHYKVDASADNFSMRFADSPGLIYHHVWSEFARYGADQVLVGRKKKYSYKITERKGDTIFFRVLEVGGDVPAYREQHYQSAFFDYVRVDGVYYDTETSVERQRPVPHTWLYPADVWNFMVRAAEIDAKKRELSWTKVVGYYNNLCNGQTYNGFEAVVGRIPLGELNWFIANVCAHALANVLRADRQNGATLQQIMTQRRYMSNSVLYNFCMSLPVAAAKAVAAPFFMLRKLFDIVSDSMKANLEWTLSVTRMPRFVKVPTSAVVPGRKVVVSDVHEDKEREFVFLQHLVDTDGQRRFMEQIDQLAAEAAEMLGRGGPPLAVTVEGEHLSASAAPHAVPSEYGGSTVVGSSSRGPKFQDGVRPDWVPELREEGTTFVNNPKAHTSAERMAAIREEMASVAEACADVESWARARWEMYCPGNVVREKKLQVEGERDNDVDLWEVREGQIVSSVRGAKKFTHGGVYCPRPIEVSDGTPGGTVLTNLLPVVEVNTSRGGDEFVDYVMLPDAPSYSGYVLVYKDLEVFNGRQVLSGLSVALNMTHDYDLVACVGGPGAGKTHTICKTFTAGQIVTTPLRKSADDLRGELVKSHKVRNTLVKKVVRTVDSLLCAVGRDPSMLAKGKLAAADMVMGDEAYSCIPARLYACLALMRCSHAFVLGDGRQVPPVVKDKATRLYLSMQPDAELQVYTVYRSVPEVLALYSGHYDHKLRTKRKGRGKVTYTVGMNDVVIDENKEFLILTMYNAAADTLKHTLPWSRHKDKIMTTHRAQGSTVDVVYLVDPSRTPGSKSAMTDLFEDPNYVNVAMSRARYEVHIVVAKANNGLVKRWFDASQNHSLVTALADVSTAGQPAKFDL